MERQYKVSKERWESAQTFEKEHWIKTQKVRARYGKNFLWRILSLLGLKSKYRGNDWNDWWKNHFDNYDFLPLELENAIELGCGPYTNIRFISEKSRIKHLFLSDPLIKDYINFKLTFVREKYIKGFCILDDHPIEECPFKSNYFNSTVMINVLDHVQDAEMCIKEAIRITKIDGILILGQDLTNNKDLENKEIKNDIGHPIKIEHEYLESFFKDNFNTIIKKILPREQGRAPDCHYGTYIFAGKKVN
ncbi:MAG: methyltransferase domain-containing protein [Candidatus Eremiobacterota bacterium]